jgi:hypothetical protein
MVRRIFTIAAVLIVLVVVWFSTFRSTSVCVECGCRSSALDFQLPLMAGSTYYRYRSIEQTPVSDVARELDFIKLHSHDWKLMHGGGSGILCALGRGVDLDPTVRSTRVARFIECTHRYHGPDEGRRWFATALEYQHSRAVHDWLRMSAFPEDGFSSVTDYQDWRRRADPQ